MPVIQAGSSSRLRGFVASPSFALVYIQLFQITLSDQSIKLRSINFRYADFNTDSADACILVMACVDCARASS